MRLPESYRQFCMQFGVGEVSEFYRIAAPLSVKSDYELSQFNSDWHGAPDEQLLDIYGTPEFTNDLYFYCSTIGGEAYVWRLSESTDSKNHEYAIYHVPRSQPVARVASNFHDFIVDYTQRPVPNHPDGRFAFTFFPY
jgi:hypothetical protein